MNIRNLIVLFMVSTGLFAQTVNGTVYDSNSRPLEGANVVLVGTDLGDTANEAGAFIVKACVPLLVPSTRFNPEPVVVVSFNQYR